MSQDELDEYESRIDDDEALVIELLDERDLSDGDELVDVAAEPDSTPFDITRVVYSGGGNGNGNGDEVDVRELRAAGALLDDPEFDDEADRADD